MRSAKVAVPNRVVVDITENRWGGAAKDAVVAAEKSVHRPAN
jgi:hypothetical protein